MKKHQPQLSKYKHIFSRSLLSFLLFAFFSVSSIQIKAQDSLVNLLLTDLQDTSRIDVLLGLSESLLSSQIDSSIVYAQQALDLAESINDVERKAFILKQLGIAYFYKGKFVDVLDYWKASLAAFESIDHPKGVSNLLSNIGAVYNSTGDYPKALTYFLNALRMAEKQDDGLRKATVLQNLGALYSNKLDFDISKSYYEKAYKLCEELDYIDCISLVSLNLSEVYEHKDSLNKASQWMNKAKSLAKENDLPFYTEAIIKSSNLKLKQKRYAEALTEAKSAYQLGVEKNSNSNLQLALTVLGKIYNQTNQTDLAITTLKESIELGREIGYNNDLKSAYEELAIAQKKNGDFLQASVTQDSLLRVNQEIFNTEKEEKVSNLQLEFDLEKRESEIALLNADNEIKNQQIAKAKVHRNLIAAVALFLIALLGGVLYMYRYAKETNKIISEEKSKSDNLLKNILPPETAEELKTNGVVQP